MAAMTDAEKLREAIRALRSSMAGSVTGGWHCEIERVCAAAESTLPKTKMQEVWRVEYSQCGRPYCAQFQSRDAADVYARTVATWPDTACIQVVSAQQEVPEA